MPSQRNVAPRFWTSLSLRGCSPECRLLMLYCMTCPRSNMAGFFRFSMEEAEEETGLARSQIESAFIESECREFMEWDSQTHYVWVYKRVYFEFPNGNISEKQREGLRRILEDCPRSPFLVRLCTTYNGLGKPFNNGYGDGLPNGSINGLGNGSNNGSGNGTDPASVSVSVTSTISGSGGSRGPIPKKRGDPSGGNGGPSEVVQENLARVRGLLNGTTEAIRNA